MVIWPPRYVEYVMVGGPLLPAAGAAAVPPTFAARDTQPPRRAANSPRNQPRRENASVVTVNSSHRAGLDCITHVSTSAKSKVRR